MRRNLKKPDISIGQMQRSMSFLPQTIIGDGKYIKINEYPNGFAISWIGTFPSPNPFQYKVWDCTTEAFVDALTLDDVTKVLYIGTGFTLVNNAGDIRLSFEMQAEPDEPWIEIDQVCNGIWTIGHGPQGASSFSLRPLTAFGRVDGGSSDPILLQLKNKKISVDVKGHVRNELLDEQALDIDATDLVYDILESPDSTITINKDGPNVDIEVADPFPTFPGTPTAGKTYVLVYHEVGDPATFEYEWVETASFTCPT